jgi:hypothetical protein
VIYCDPPEGWRFGFPKVIPEDQMKRTKEWLVQNGYPEELMDEYGEHFYIRYWRDNESE